jgi:ATP-binding cassette subfamily B protein
LKFTHLITHITPHRNTLLLILGLLIIESLFSLANPWMAGQLTILALGSVGSFFNSINGLLLAWLGLMAATGLVGFASVYLVGSTGEEMASNLRSRVHEHMQILPMSYFQQQRPGDLLTLLSNDSEIISDFVTTTLVQLLPLLTTFVGAFVIMVYLDPVIALMAAVLMPAYFLAMKILGRNIRPISAAWNESWSNLMSLVQENLGLFPAIKAFSREPHEVDRFESRNAELLKWSKKRIYIQALLSPAINLLAGAGLLLLLWIGFKHIQNGQLATADLVSLLLYAAMLTRPVSGLANVYGQVQRTRGAAERLLEFFSEQAEPLYDNKPPLRQVKGAVDFRDITFAYSGRAAVFTGFNLSIAAGETIALTGPNGAGKSTLAHLLLRFIEPSQGCILIDGTDISEVSLPSLRESVGLVAQNTLLLNGTIAENIAYGRHQASHADLVQAAKAAQAAEFIEQLPNGYDTVIGDQGLRLSGGQRQRLSLARTLLKNPSILILDEATSMFDPSGESSFIEDCREILQRRTVILITHRPASLALANRIIQLNPATNLTDPYISATSATVLRQD